MSEFKYLTIDGNTAAALSAYAFTEIAGIYPITPSSPMADSVDKWAKEGKLNIFNQTVNVVEMQSEAGASGLLHGAAASGVLTSTFTASQGLLLMIPDMYKIAGEMLPVVLHVAARTVATHALSIFGDHSDVMAARATGFNFIASSSVQEAHDLAAVAHLAAIRASMPFLHFFDGFRTSHELQKTRLLPYSDLEKLVDKEAIKAFRKRALTPNNPVLYGSNQNPDIFFQSREAINGTYAGMAEIIAEEMAKINALTGKNYQLFNYYGAADAEYVVVAMGSICETIKATLPYLSARGSKVGLIQVHVYRPFAAEHFLAQIPASCKRIAVLDRTKEPGAGNEPLKLDVIAALSQAERKIQVLGGRYGLSSKDTTPDDILALFKNLQSDSPKKEFTLAITDDVTHLSLPRAEHIDTTDPDTISCRFWGMGSDGTVGANKNSIKIIGDNTERYVQAYFSYDSKKSGGLTISDLRFGKREINQPYLINSADFVSCSQQSYVYKYDMLDSLKEGGSFLLNSIWEAEDVERFLPAAYKRALAQKNIKFYLIDAHKITNALGLGRKTNTVLQAAFFSITGVLPKEEAIAYMHDSITKTYQLKGEQVVKMNQAAVEQAFNSVVEIPVQAAWLTAVDDRPVGNMANLIAQAPAWKSREQSHLAVPQFINDFAAVVNRQQGDSLPVSAFLPHMRGNYPQGTTRYEKRAIALEVPEWVADNCIQCNQCSLVCPHAVIRPFLISDEELEQAPDDMAVLKGAKPYDQYKFRIQISPLDCTGCASCVETCPAPNKALRLREIKTQLPETDNWDYLINLPPKANPMKPTVVKGSQFERPYFEFSGACAGCGETPYIKLVTQLFGDKMTISNATGCSSIYGGAVPSQPYCQDAQGRGPAWTNSLFEDNAENGFGIHLASLQLRERVAALLRELGEKLTVEFMPSHDAELMPAHDYEAASGEAEVTSETTTVMPDAAPMMSAAAVTAPASNAAVMMSVCNDVLKNITEWLEHREETQDTVNRAEQLSASLRSLRNNLPQYAALIDNIFLYEDYFTRRSDWIIGGDGWAYDIGFGGLDHVISTGADVNILILDTEVYSNTGGQASKATPRAAIAQFAAGGKPVRKKDLGLMAMTYGYVYVAQIAMGANQSQTLKAIAEAEAYKGPSVIIAYAPCIEHGIKGGLRYVQEIEKNAVESGYWQLYRYDPTRKASGKNPFQLDCKPPKGNFADFLKREVRYTALFEKYSPEEVEAMIASAESDARERYLTYWRKSKEHEIAAPF